MNKLLFIKKQLKKQKQQEEREWHEESKHVPASKGEKQQMSATSEIQRNQRPSINLKSRRKAIRLRNHDQDRKKHKINNKNQYGKKNNMQENNKKEKYIIYITWENEKIIFNMDTNLAIKGEWNMEAWFRTKQNIIIATATWNQRGTTTILIYNNINLIVFFVKCY